MAVDVVIKSGGLFKKNIDINDIIFDGMKYGIMDDSYRFDEGKLGNYMVVFDSSHICRGYEVALNGKEISLRMPIPTSKIDIEFFYDYIEKICKVVKAKNYVRNDLVSEFENKNLYIEEDCCLSRDALKIMEEDMDIGKYEHMYLFGVMNPITISKVDLIKVDRNLEKLGKFMDEKQRLDLYYAKANVYKRNDGSIFGMYVLTEDVESIFPLRPSVFMARSDLEVADWNVSFFINNEICGSISYDDFINNVNHDEKYDSEHFIIKLSKNKMLQLLKRYKRDL